MCNCHNYYLDGRHKSSCSQTAEVDMDLAAPAGDPSDPDLN